MARMKERRGSLCTYRVKGHIYWMASVSVCGRHLAKTSRDRAVCAAWLAERLAEFPTYEAAAPAAGRYRRAAEWCVAAEADPMSAAYHMRYGGDWPRPRRVLARDIVNDVPVAWVADDNGGEGHTFAKANGIARTMRRDGTGIKYYARKMNGLRTSNGQ